MADLQIICYGQIANDGNIPVADYFLGKKTISTLSDTSQSVALERGTRYVKLATDANEIVYFNFGSGSATATTDSDELRADQGHNVEYAGTTGVDYIAARIA